MPRSISLSGVTQHIQKLLAARQKHVDAMAAIDQALDEIRGLVAPHAVVAAAPARQAVASPVTPRQPKEKTGRRRKTYATTGAESILGFVQAEGDPTTQDIKRHWQSEQRRGSADNVLTQLVKARELKRTPLVGERGSRYTVA